MKEKNQSIIKLHDIDFELFQTLLLFIYQKRVTFDSVSDCIEILYAANQFQIHELEALCISFLCTNIELESFVDVMECAMDLQVQVIVTNLVSWFLQNFQSIDLDKRNECASSYKEQFWKVLDIK